MTDSNKLVVGYPVPLRQEFPAKIIRENGDSLQSLFNILAPHIGEDKRKLDWFYQFLNLKVQAEYPLRQAERHLDIYLSGRELMGIISFDAFSAFVDVLQNKDSYGWSEQEEIEPVEKPVTVFVGGTSGQEAESLEDDSPDVPINEFRKEIQILRNRKAVSLAKIYHLLPENIKNTVSCRRVIDYAQDKSSAQFVNAKIAKAIFETYQKFPDQNQPVLSDEVLDPFVFERQVRSMVSVSISHTMIRKALRANRLRWKDMVSDFSDCIGQDEIEAVNLLYKPSGGIKFFPRLRVAIVLRLIEGKDVPQEAIDLHNHHLDDKYKGFDVSKMRERLNEIFERAKLPPKFVYDSMPDEYKQSVDFNKVAGWFDGQVDRSKRSHVESFLHQAIKLLEQDYLPL